MLKPVYQTHIPMAVFEGDRPWHSLCRLLILAERNLKILDLCDFIPLESKILLKPILSYDFLISSYNSHIFFNFDVNILYNSFER